MKRPFQLLSAICLPALVAVLAPGCSDDNDVCAAPLATCSGACVDVRYDPAHCGACGVKCGDGEVCGNGVCSDGCPDGLTDCDGRCVNLEIDPAHCGACGEACGAGLLCSMGSCNATCIGGTTECDDACFDTSTDEANCGGCGMACGAGETCVASACVPGCDSDQTLCANVCVDTDFDVMNCGGCGTVCADTQVCVVGSCEDVDPLGVILTSAYGSAVSQDLYVINDYTFDRIKVNPVTFASDTVIDYRVVPDGSLVLVAAQDTEDVFELYHAPNPGAALVKLSGALVADGDVEPGIVLSSDGGTVLYRADADADGVIDLFAVDLANPGSPTKVNPALGANADVAAGMAISTDGTTVAYLADQDTDGVNDAYVVSLATPGVSTRVNTPTLRSVEALAITSDGSTVVYRAPQDFLAFDELYQVAVATPGVSTKINPGGDGGEGTPVGNVFEFQLTHDDTRAVMRVRRGYGSRELYVASLSGTPDPTRLSQSNGTTGFVGETFAIASDDSVVIYQESLGGAQQVYAADLAAPGMVIEVSDGSDEGDDVNDFVLSADDTAVVFRRGLDGGEGQALYQVVLSSPGVSTQLTPALSEIDIESGYAVTSDGSRVLYRRQVEAFTSNHHAFVASNETPGVALEVNPPLLHEFPSQRKLVVDATSDLGYLIADLEAEERDELVRVDASTPGVVEKVNAALPVGGDVRAFEVSEDGSTIVYEASGDAAGVYELFLVDSANPGMATKLSPPAAANSIVDFQVSADGSTIVYRSHQESANVWDLYAVSAATPGTANKLNGALTSLEDVSEYVVSPDGATVVFRINNAIAPNNIYSVAVANPGVTTVLNHTLVGSGVTDFAMSHDWTTVAYVGVETAQRELFSVALSAPTVQTKLSGALLGGRDVVDVAWSHDDSFVIYRADDVFDNVFELFRVDVSTPGVAAKVNDAIVTGTISNFVISPNDQLVAYASTHEATRRSLFLADLVQAVPDARLHAMSPSTSHDVQLDYAFTSTSSHVVYRGDLEQQNRVDIWSSATASPGTGTRLHDVQGSNGTTTETWGFTSQDEVLFMRSAISFINEAFQADPAAPGVATRLTPIVGPTRIRSVAVAK